MSNSFDRLGLPEPLLETLSRLDYTDPFPIQEAAIPPGLAGRDLQGGAPTGSGKTLAFGLPLLARVDRAERNRPAALVLAPTRELAEQIKNDLDPFARAVGRRVSAVYGGVGYGPQLSALRNGVDVLVATPGRLLDLIERRAVGLERVTLIVIDEADRMADMGFLPDVRRILGGVKGRRQTFLFSATLDGEIAVLSKEYQKDPVRIEAEARDELPINVVHHFWRVDRSDRVAKTASVIEATGRGIVFTRTRHGADRLVKQLSKTDVVAVAMHGGRSQSQRTRALNAFSTGKAQALVATDVAARGIHVENVEAVVHFDIPADSKDYIHRSGRTARAGAAGVVVSLVTEGQDHAVKKLLRDLNIQGRVEAPQLDQLGATSARVQPRRGGDVRSPGRRQDSARRERQSIYVGNLPWKTTSGELEEMFSRYGKVERATIKTQTRSGRSKGFGFVDIVEHDPGAAVRGLDGVLVGGRPLRIRPAQ
ncbi:MAG TPA: DEAD/DEAH box helicase [Acidimicrobiia bacterium]|nr:DEAD/DEAH box helicase [Acidimicrobiia bacterium]